MQLLGFAGSLFTISSGFFSQAGEINGTGTIVNSRPADTFRLKSWEIIAGSARAQILPRPTVFDVCMIAESHIKAQPNGWAAGKIAPGTVLSSALSRAYGVCFWLHCLLL